MTITLSNALPTVDGFRPLWASTGWFADRPPTDADLVQALSATWTAVSAYDGGRLIGFGRAISDGVLHALICEVIVLPAYQNRGIGTAIMRRLLDTCRAANIRSIQLFCAPGKRAFYERFGFVPRADGAPGMEWRPD